MINLAWLMLVLFIFAVLGNFFGRLKTGQSVGGGANNAGFSEIPNGEGVRRADSESTGVSRVTVKA